MNKDRILRLAERVEKMPHLSDAGYPLSPTARVFSMHKYYFDCGAPACIAGHAEVMAEEEYGKNFGVGNFFHTPQNTADYLELGYDIATELCEPSGFGALTRITPQHAAACLRHLVETGEVEWGATRP